MTDILRVTILGSPVPAQMGVMASDCKGRPKVLKSKRSTAYQQQISSLTMFAINRGDWRWRTDIASMFVVRLHAFVADLRVIDVDNIGKNALDGLKCVAFADDRQVKRLEVEKDCDRLTPRLEIEVERIVTP